MTLYGDDEFNVLKLKLENCESEEAFIEVGLKATPVAKVIAPSASSPLLKSPSASSLSNAADAQSLLMMLNELEATKKSNAKVVKDYEAKEKNLNSKINNLQTQLENEKNNNNSMGKQTAFWQEEVAKQKELASKLQKTLEARASDLSACEDRFA